MRERSVAAFLILVALYEAGALVGWWPTVTHWLRVLRDHNYMAVIVVLGGFTIWLWPHVLRGSA